MVGSRRQRNGAKKLDIPFTFDLVGYIRIRDRPWL